MRSTWITLYRKFPVRSPRCSQDGELFNSVPSTFWRKCLVFLPKPKQTLHGSTQSFEICHTITVGVPQLHVPHRKERGSNIQPSIHSAILTRICAHAPPTPYPELLSKFCLKSCFSDVTKFEQQASARSGSSWFLSREVFKAQGKITTSVFRV